MFTGIIETLGRVRHIEKDQTNLILTIESEITQELKVDQSVAHNGVCLTITKICDSKSYQVVAINETLQKTNLRRWQVGHLINLERCMSANGRFDGHFVQGHVDQVGLCTKATDENGSWRYTFEYDHQDYFTIEKGSITVNGVSLTVVDARKNQFGVAIIPYTYENTNFKSLKKGAEVNLEFDALGKYVTEILKRQRQINAF